LVFDSEVAIRVIAAGFSEAMREAAKSQGISISWLHDMFADRTKKADSAKNASDILTKALGRELFERHAVFLGLGDFKHLGDNPYRCVGSCEAFLGTYERCLQRVKVQGSLCSACVDKECMCWYGKNEKGVKNKTLAVNACSLRFAMMTTPAKCHGGPIIEIVCNHCRGTDNVEGGVCIACRLETALGAAGKIDVSDNLYPELDAPRASPRQVLSASRGRGREDEPVREEQAPQEPAPEESRVQVTTTSLRDLYIDAKQIFVEAQAQFYQESEGFRKHKILKAAFDALASTMVRGTTARRIVNEGLVGLVGIDEKLFPVETILQVGPIVEALHEFKKITYLACGVALRLTKSQLTQLRNGIAPAGMSVVHANRVIALVNEPFHVAQQDPDESSWGSDELRWRDDDDMLSDDTWQHGHGDDYD